MAKPPTPWREIDDKTPVEYVQDNPKKIGSNAYDLYEKYKKSKTFGEAKANGARTEDFRFDYAKGLLKIHFINAPKVSKGLENKGSARKPKPEPKTEPKLETKLSLKADLEAAKDKVAPFPTLARSSGGDSPKLPRSMAVGPLGSLPSRARKEPSESEGAAESQNVQSLGSNADSKENAKTGKEPNVQKDKGSGASTPSSEKRAKRARTNSVGLLGSKSSGSKADSQAPASSSKKVDDPFKVKKEKKDKREKKDKDKKDKKEKKHIKHEKLDKKHRKDKRDKKLHRLTGKRSTDEASGKTGELAAKSSGDRTRKGINVSFALGKLLKNSRARAKEKSSGENKAKRDAEGLWVRESTDKTCASKYLGVVKSSGTRGFRAQFNRLYLGTFETEKEAARIYAKARKEWEEGRSLTAEQVSRSNEARQTEPSGAGKPAVLATSSPGMKVREAPSEEAPAPKAAAPERAHLANLAPAPSKAPESPGAPKASAPGAPGTRALDGARAASLGRLIPPDRDKEELQKKIRELERKNESQQRQIEALEAEKAVEQRSVLHGQDCAPVPAQEFVAPAPIQPPRPEGYAAEYFVTNSTEGCHVVGWIGEGGGWEPGGEPPRNAQLPPIPPGDTEPPGPCGPMCRCGQVVSKASEVEKPWIADEARKQAILAALERFQSHPGVERRGKVSHQNRFEPAAPEKMNRALTSESSRTHYTREVRVLR